jgi:hypothetical protein
MITLRRAWMLLLSVITFAAWLSQPEATSRAVTREQSTKLESFSLLESTEPVFDVLYRYGHLDSSSTGAYGANINAPRSHWFLEYQRAGGYDITAGVVRSDPALVAEGLRMLHFGLAREAPNGSFPGSYSPFHGTAMFLSEAAPGLVMLRNSTLASRFDVEIRWQVQKMDRAAHFLPRVVGGVARIDDYSKNHRRFEAALAFGSVGFLASDRTLVKWSRAYAWQGVRMARSTGVMPEDGGHDSGYQALGMVNAIRYLDLLATGKLYSALHGVLQRGEAWELTRVRRDGSVNQDGDTRTAHCREHDLVGACKTVFYAPIFSAFAHWAHISADPRYASAAFLVWQKSGYGGH